MAKQVERSEEWAGGRRRRIQRAVLMHATSPYRESAARLLAKLLQESGASGVAFGWTDVIAPALLSPVHVVTAHPGVLWSLGTSSAHAEVVDPDPPFEWQLVLKGASPRRIASLQSTIEHVKGYFAQAGSRDVPHALGPDNSDVHGFVALLDSFRFCGFTLARKAAPAIRGAFRDEIGGLPEATQDTADAVVAALRDHPTLQEELLRLGTALDVAGAFDSAAGVHLIAYELALQRCDGMAGIDAARSAGRVLRRMGELGESLRWYRLAARIAEFEEAWDRLALALDGAGNTYRHQGSFPRARETYEKAWKYAEQSDDSTAIGNVAHSMMTVSREAGDLAAAARYGWMSLSHRKGAGARANLLINLGTLLREGGDVDSAERAFRIAHQQTEDAAVRTMAADALAYSAALRGSVREYTRWHREVNRSRLHEPFLRAQIGYFRGLSLAALGRRTQSERVLQAVERYARRWNLAEWEVKAAEAELPPPQSSPVETPVEVRQGLRELEVASR